MRRRPDRPVACEGVLDAEDDVCLGCPSAIPPCSGIADRALCPGIAEAARHARQHGKARGSLADAIRRARGPLPAPAVLLRTYLAADEGYGQIAERYGRLLEARGVPVAYEPIIRGEHFHRLPAWVEDRIGPGAGAPWVLQLAVPVTEPPPGRPVVFASMWESSRIAPDGVAFMNRCAGVIVPCRFNAEGFAASGVRTPIRVVPLGIDPADGFAPAPPPPPGGPFRFGCAGRMSHGGIRKGLRECVAAFLEASAAGMDAVLEVKVHPDCDLADPGHPRVIFRRESLLPAGMAAWLKGLDVYVCPSKGEGWGLITHQAMAVGRPVIAAPWSGTADFFDGRCGWELGYDLAPAGEFYAGLGEWAVPRHGDMVRAMRAAYADRRAVAAKGRAAARRAAEFPWERTGDALLAALREFGMAGPGSAGQVSLASSRRRLDAPDVQH